MKAKSYISYFKKWFWSLFVLSFVLLILSLCVLLLKEESLRIEIVLSSIVLYSTLLIGTIPYFINSINDRSNLLSKISLIFYIFIIISCILSIVFNGILIQKIKNKTEKKYESTVIVILSSFLFLLYLGNLFIETEMKISIQNMKNYTTEQQAQFQLIQSTIKEDPPRYRMVKRKKIKSLFPNSRKDENYQFVEVPDIFNKQKRYIKREKGTSVVYNGKYGNTAFV